MFRNVKEWYSNKSYIIKKLEDEIKTIKSQISVEKNSIPNELRGFDLSQEDIDYLYWETSIGKQSIANGMNMAQKDVRISEKPINIICKCGGLAQIVYAKTTTEYAKIKEEIDRKEKIHRDNLHNKQVSLRYVCDKCEVDRYKIINYNLRHMPYKEYLTTSHWQLVRSRALSAAGNRCQICNSDKQLNVHHRTYENRGNEKPSDVTVLCRMCHEKFHDVRKVKL